MTKGLSKITVCKFCKDIWEYTNLKIKLTVVILHITNVALSYGSPLKNFVKFLNGLFGILIEK